MYIPNAQNTPIFKGKNDVILVGSFSNYHLAYAPTSNLGFMVNGYYRDINYLHLHNGKTDDYEGSAKMIEGGVGYFKKNENTTVSIFGGWGRGYCSIAFSQAYIGVNRHESHYNRLFLQPNVSFGSDKIQCIVSTRLSFVNLYDFKDGPIIYNVSQNTTPFFLEPSFTLQIKMGTVYFQSQLQGSIATTELSDAYNGYTPYQSFPIINAGFVIHLADLFRAQ